jgi:hypothetical protein
VVIGVPSYADPEELTIGFLLKMPFKKTRKWDKGSERNYLGNENGKLLP